jgi:hypothetical protein
MQPVWPKDIRGQADVSRWLYWEAAPWSPGCTPMAVERVVKKLAGLGDPNPAEIARGEQLFHPLAAVLNGHLRGRKWLLGSELTIADFGVATGLAFMDAAQFPVEKYDEMVRWYHTFRAPPAGEGAGAAASPASPSQYTRRASWSHDTTRRASRRSRSPRSCAWPEDRLHGSRRSAALAAAARASRCRPRAKSSITGVP